MTKVDLKEAAAKTGAVCLDGSPAAYYFKAGTGVNSSKWVLHLEGGGYCVSKESCFLRAHSSFGSSIRAPSFVTFSGPLDENPSVNPDFYDWNHVYLHYCDGASFAGELAEPIVVNGHPVYYRGLRNLKAIINDLLDNKGLNNADEVFLNGGSAGGIAVFLHADRIGKMLPKTVRRYKASPFSGTFLDIPNAEGVSVVVPMLKNAYLLHNCSGGVHPDCLASFGQGSGYMCMFAEHTVQYIKTPLFISNSAYDLCTTSCFIGGEPTTNPNVVNNCSAVPGWGLCEANPQNCTQDQWKAIENLGETFSKTFENNKAVNSAGNGLFEYSCHDHVAELHNNAWNVITVQGTTMRQAITKWYFSNNEPASKHIYKDCKNQRSYCCNPTCCSSNSHIVGNTHFSKGVREYNQNVPYF